MINKSRGFRFLSKDGLPILLGRSPWRRHIKEVYFRVQASPRHEFAATISIISWFISRLLKRWTLVRTLCVSASSPWLVLSIRNVFTATCTSQISPQTAPDGLKRTLVEPVSLNHVHFQTSVIPPDVVGTLVSAATSPDKSVTTCLSLLAEIEFLWRRTSLEDDEASRGATGGA